MKTLFKLAIGAAAVAIGTGVGYAVARNQSKTNVKNNVKPFTHTLDIGVMYTINNINLKFSYNVDINVIEGKVTFIGLGEDVSIPTDKEPLEAVLGKLNLSLAINDILDDHCGGDFNLLKTMDLKSLLVKSRWLADKSLANMKLEINNATCVIKTI